MAFSHPTTKETLEKQGVNHITHPNSHRNPTSLHKPLSQVIPQKTNSIKNTHHPQTSHPAPPQSHHFLQNTKKSQRERYSTKMSSLLINRIYSSRSGILKKPIVDVDIIPTSPSEMMNHGPLSTRKGMCIWANYIYIQNTVMVSAL